LGWHASSASNAGGVQGDWNHGCSMGQEGELLLPVTAFWKVCCQTVCIFCLYWMLCLFLQFPFFCSDREYIIGRRIWASGKTYYCVTKVCDEIVLSLSVREKLN
jgi:hypothetical protein